MLRPPRLPTASCRAQECALRTLSSPSPVSSHTHNGHRPACDHLWPPDAHSQPSGARKPRQQSQLTSCLGHLSRPSVTLLTMSCSCHPHGNSTRPPAGTPPSSPLLLGVHSAGSPHSALGHQTAPPPTASTQGPLRWDAATALCPVSPGGQSWARPGLQLCGFPSAARPGQLWGCRRSHHS